MILFSRKKSNEHIILTSKERIILTSKEHIILTK